ncbi:carboxypeptidase regulatory-like domain-containing protein [Patescibacteria group bacterium]|nr:carboxypeptidase regulatory-like domain-containing protein [Patescibacteria group bacterium]
MHAPRGMSLIDVVIGTALVLIIFLALFGILRASILLSAYVKSEATATSIANNQVEYIRSLPYDSVGTLGGIPAGLIAQNATTTEDGVGYNVRTFIDYYDSPSDGTGAGDTNGITTDYKRIKVTVFYTAGGKPRQFILVSNYAPLGIETTAGGGTLQINVVNAAGTPLAGASVTITNASTAPTVNLTTFSDSTGTVYLPGAATSTQYAVSVTKTGYSTAQTYVRDSNNQNPTPGYLTVVKNQTTSSTFAIDALGSMNVMTFSPIATSTFSDSFANASKLTSLTSTVASGGALSLSGGVGNYAASGSAISTTSAPAYLIMWGVASSTQSVPAGTTVSFHIVDGTGTLLPDSVLAGNAAGFISTVNLYGISTTTYPALALSASLSTTATSTTPSITNWGLSYQSGPTPLPNVSFTLTGKKTIGSTGGGAPIYKTTVNATTSATGTNLLTLEWDLYSLSVPSYDIIDACTVPPYALAPAAAVNESLILSTHSTNALLVSVADSLGDVVSGVSVTLSRPGYSKVVTSSACGAAYFGSLSAASDYSITITKSGYTTNTVSGVSVTGQTFYADSF